MNARVFVFLWMCAHVRESVRVSEEVLDFTTDPGMRKPNTSLLTTDTGDLIIVGERLLYNAKIAPGVPRNLKTNLLIFQFRDSFSWTGSHPRQFIHFFFFLQEGSLCTKPGGLSW